MKYIPLNCKTHYSVRQAMSKPTDIKTRLDKIELDLCGVADYSIVSGAVKFKDSVPNGIIGTEICDLAGNKTLIYAKNYNGWKQLLKITSVANSKSDTCLDRYLLDALITNDLLVIYLYEENNPKKTGIIKDIS
jgi:DNA polymerase III alpha subunit